MPMGKYKKMKKGKCKMGMPMMDSSRMMHKMKVNSTMHKMKKSMK